MQIMPKLGLLELPILKKNETKIVFNGSDFSLLVFGSTKEETGFGVIDERNSRIRKLSLKMNFQAITRDYKKSKKPNLPE